MFTVNSLKIKIVSKEQLVESIVYPLVSKKGFSFTIHIIQITS